MLSIFLNKCNRNADPKSLNSIVILLSLFFAASCKKLIKIPPPTSSITTTQVFSTDGQATSAATGMYEQMINGNDLFSNIMTLCGGISADELLPFQSGTLYRPFQKNALLSSNSTVGGAIWTPAYTAIYTANAVITGVETSTDVHDSVKNELTGEAKFIRALADFYLVNLFGDVPLVTTTNWHNTSLISRSPVADVYQFVIDDLKDAQNRLPADYSVGNGKRIIPNKWAATALLARVYLYRKDWDSAAAQATALINNVDLFKLEPNLNDVFLATSNEAIWQLQQPSNGVISYNVTQEGYLFVPALLDSTFSPGYYLTPQLLNAFEPGDLRRSKWVDSTRYEGIEYYFPYKYKMGSGQIVAGAPASEYYMVLRFAEQYLIRAEAEANGANGGLTAAITDLNVLRARAGLTGLSLSLTLPQVTAAIAHERQIELFAEWGHRWLDLKRTGQATTVLSAEKGFTVSNNALLWPIPVYDLGTDPNLTQNEGY